MPASFLPPHSGPRKGAAARIGAARSTPGCCPCPPSGAQEGHSGRLGAGHVLPLGQVPCPPCRVQRGPQDRPRRPPAGAHHRGAVQGHAERFHALGTGQTMAAHRAQLHTGVLSLPSIRAPGGPQRTPGRCSCLSPGWGCPARHAGHREGPGSPQEAHAIPAHRDAVQGCAARLLPLTAARGCPGWR